MSAPSSPDADRNLLFGVLCLQADLIDEARFAEACALWAAKKTVPLPDLLQERGWISATDRGHIDFLVQRKLQKHGGDARQSLADVADAGVRDIVRSVADHELRHTVSQLPPGPGYVLLSTTAAPPEQRLRYTLTRLHGEGGLGRVYVAHDNDLNRDVALKEIRPEKAKHPEAWQRFLKEAQLTGQLEHPNIVPVYEVARREEDQSPFYTMRLVRGQTLREAIADYHLHRREGCEDPLERLRLLNAFVSVCQAIGYAHSRGVIHRDLKPDNIMLGGFGEVIVLDWGLAKTVDHPDDPSEAPEVALTEQARTDATGAGRVLGTPAYAAPEQAEGRTDLIDTRTDIYGLGTILFEILTGRAPHTGENTAALLRHVATAASPRALAAEPSVPRALDAVCAKAMAKNKADRYARAADLSREVQRFLADEPVLAYREPLLTQTSRWARRHRTMVSAAGVLLVAGVFFLTALAVLIERARERTEAERLRADRNFQRARQAVDDYFTTVSQNKLLGEPHMEPLRKELLEKAQKYYEEFAQAEEGAADPEVRGELATAQYRVAAITDLTGAPEAAWPGYRKAAARFEEVLGESPDNAEWRNSLGLCHNSWGLSHEEHGSMEEALRHFDKARAILEPLVDDRPDEEKFRGSLARVYFNTGLWNYRTGQVKEAVGFYEKAQVLQEKIVTDNVRAADYESDLALTYMNLGSVHLENGRPEQALPLYEKTLAIESRLTDLYPKSLYYRRTLGAARHNLAMLYRMMSQTARALEEYGKARTLRQELVAKHPSVIDYQHDLGETLNNIGEVQLFLRNEDESNATWVMTEDVFRRAAQEIPSSPKSRNHLGLAHNNLGVVVHQLGRGAESLEHQDQAIQLRERLARDNPLVVDFGCFVADSTSNRGNALRLLDRKDEAIAAYRKSAALYDPLIRDHPTTTRYRSNQGIVYGNIGYILEDVERVEEALDAYEKSRAVRASLVALNPNVPRFQADLALAHFCVAKAQTKISIHRHAGPVGAAFTSGPSPLLYLPFLFAPPGEVDGHYSPEAEENYNKALAIQLKLTADFPELPDYQADLGRTYVQLGNLYRDKKDLVEAFGQHKKALDVWKPLVAGRPKVAEYRHNLAIAHYNNGLTMQDLRLALLALNAHEESRRLREVLIAEKPDEKDCRRDLASTYNGLGLANLSLRRYDQALAWFERAEATWNPVVTREPNSARHRSNRARAPMNKGITLFEMGKPALAIVEYQRAIEMHREAVDRAPAHFKYRELLGKTYQKMSQSYRALGMLDEAAWAVKEWRNLWTLQAAPLVDVAGELAQCIVLMGEEVGPLTEAQMAQRRLYPDEAVQMLRQALALGYQDRDRLAREPNLDPLRGRSDFQQLLAQ
jgi:eukaryotic-like serine/threonine-protein kinase